MNTKTLALSKSRLSQILLLSFLVLLAFTIIYTELFKKPGVELDMKRLALNPLKTELLEGISKIDLIQGNNIFSMGLMSGSHDFNGDGLDDDTKNLAWEMVEPINNSIRAEMINKFIRILKNLTPLQVYQLEPINLSNFNLDKPWLTMKLVTQKNKLAEMSIGLSDNNSQTTYLSITTSQDSKIYAVPIIRDLPTNFQLSQLLDTKIISGHNREIEIIEIYKGNNLDQDPILVLLKKDQNWYGPSYELLKSSAVSDFLEKAFNLKSTFILDKADEATTAELEKLKAEIEHTLIVKNKSNNGVSYLFSKPMTNFPGLNLEKKSHVVWVSGRTQSYIVDRDQLQFLQTKQKDLNE